MVEQQLTDKFGCLNEHNFAAPGTSSSSSLSPLSWSGGAWSGELRALSALNWKLSASCQTQLLLFTSMAALHFWLWPFVTWPAMSWQRGEASAHKTLMRRICLSRRVVFSKFLIRLRISFCYSTFPLLAGNYKRIMPFVTRLSSALCPSGACIYISLWRTLMNYLEVVRCTKGIGNFTRALCKF